MRGSTRILGFALAGLLTATAPALARDYSRSVERLMQRADELIAEEQWAEARDVLKKASVLSPEMADELGGILDIVEAKCADEATRHAAAAEQALRDGDNSGAERSCKQALRNASTRHPARARCTQMLSSLALEDAYREIAANNLRTAREMLQHLEYPSPEAHELLEEVDGRCREISAEYLTDARRAWLEDNSMAACTYCRLGLSFASAEQNADDVYFCMEVMKKQCSRESRR